MSEQQAAQAEEQTPVIGLAGKRKWGYKVSQVDDFLEHAHDLYEQVEPALTQEEIQLQSFDLEHNGYVIGQVDATLIRLEKAVVDKQTQWDIDHLGRVAWDTKTRELALSLKDRAEREHKDRFKPGEKRTPSYDKKQVDQLIDQTWSHIARELDLPAASHEEVKGADQVSAAQVANVIFTQKRAKSGYDEASVDSYLNRVIQVLTRLESIVRVSAGAETSVNFAPSVAEQPEQDSLPSFAPATGVAEPAVTSVSAQASGLDDTPLSERTAAFSPFDFEEETAQPAPAPVTTTSDEQGSFAPEQEQSAAAAPASSLAGLVHAVDPVEQGANNEERAQLVDEQSAEAQVPPSFIPQEESAPTRAASSSFFDFQNNHEEPESSPAAENQVSGAQPSEGNPETSDTPAKAAEPDPDKYLSSVLNHTSVQTSSFEIPNLTFPSVGEDESDDKANNNK